jgi:hypothetical protein
MLAEETTNGGKVLGALGDSLLMGNKGASTFSFFTSLCTPL